MLFSIFRNVNIILIFLRGIGPDYEYKFFVYIPSLIFNIVVLTLMSLVIEDKKKRMKVYLVGLFIFFALYILAHYQFIPDWLVPI